MDDPSIRNIIIRSVAKYNKPLNILISYFYALQRGYQMNLEFSRNTWYLSDNEHTLLYKREIYLTRLNTVKNLQNFDKGNKNYNLEFLALINILKPILINKFKKSENSLYKFIDKLSNNNIKQLKEKQLSKTRKILTKHFKVKINAYYNSQINYTNLKKIIIDIQKLNFTTEKTKIERDKIIRYLDNIICNHHTKKNYNDIASFVNYLPDHLYNKICGCIK